VEEVAFVPIEDLTGIEGFDEGISEELQARAKAYLEERDEILAARSKELGITDDLMSLEGLTPAMLVALGENEIKTRDDLADLASDELLEFLPAKSLNEEQANEIIMAARAHWFEDEDKEAAAGEEAGEVTADETEPAKE
ncbi:MAG: helix-hairpin-helix domain-containing protein, partial [Rhodospirillales bacterium]